VLGACIIGALALAPASCSSGHEPDGSSTPTLSGTQRHDAGLVAGRRLWIDNCMRCHGSAGHGGVGPELAGRKVLDDFPAVAAQVEFVRNGRGIMPAWKNLLSEREIEDVVRFTRQVLDHGRSGD
jgi:mono/diheme cytochrome c family protein